jgi:tRNA (guanine37-N1)-methyltransferase
MRIDIITLFPNMFAGPFAESIIGRAIEHHLVTIMVHDLRDYGLGKHHVVDDRPHGGGPGMVLKPEPLFELVERIKRGDRVPVILLSPQGRLFSQKVARELATHEQLVLICGHYEGVDERVCEHLVSDEISIGDYVLTGGELAAMVVVDAIVRLLPGVLGSEESARDDSHASGLLQYPQYTRPQVYRGWAVPQVLLTGNHSQVDRWRREQSLLRTLARRPDLLEKADLSPEERRIVKAERYKRG